MLINFEWFKREAEMYSYTSKSMVNYISEFLKEKEIAFIYPKKLTVSREVNEWEIFVITGQGLYLFHPVEEGHRLKDMEMRYYNLEEIVSVTLCTPRDLKIAKLELNLRNGEQIEFDSLEDSDEDWTADYAEVIFKLAKYLTK